MLQQTRAQTAIPYWTRFLTRFPTLQSLAEAPEQDVLKAWEGLGYYSRARNLQRGAQQVVRQGGRLPGTVEELRRLPGIGEYTAGAIASIVFGVRTPAIDGNVKRVIARYCGIRDAIEVPSVQRRIRQTTDALIPQDRPGDFNQALMELGARICLPAAQCGACPLRPGCDAYAAGDADALPVRAQKAPKRTVMLGVALITHAGRVLLYRREDRLLQGMWCFPALEGAENARSVERYVRESGVIADYVENIGHARHVFTHLVWEMELLHFRAAAAVCPAQWQWVDAEQLASLPLPAAMRAAREQAALLLGGPP